MWHSVQQENILSHFYPLDIKSCMSKKARKKSRKQINSFNVQNYFLFYWHLGRYEMKLVFKSGSRIFLLRAYLSDLPKMT